MSFRFKISDKILGLKNDFFLGVVCFYQKKIMDFGESGKI